MYFRHQLLFFQLSNFDVVLRRTTLEEFDVLREVFVFLLQFLQVRTQAHKILLRFQNDPIAPQHSANVTPQGSKGSGLQAYAKFLPKP